MPNSIDVPFNQAIDTIIDAKLAARSFPGLKVKPSQDDASSWDVVHTYDHRFDRLSVPLEHLVVQVEDVKIELEAVYGEHGELDFVHFWEERRSSSHCCKIEAE